MYQAIGVIELKSIAKGIEAADAALKSAGVRLVSSHASCPGKYEIILTGVISDVTAATEVVRNRFDDRMIDSCVIGRVDPQVITALFGTVPAEKKGSLGIIETYSAASIIKAADIAVKTAKVSIFELRTSRGMGGKGICLITGEVGDVTAAVEAGAKHAQDAGVYYGSSVIAAPHADLWDQI